MLRQLLSIRHRMSFRKTVLELKNNKWFLICSNYQQDIYGKS